MSLLKFLSLFIFLFPTLLYAQSYMLLPIVEVYDGDTIKTDLSWRLPYPLNKVSIRIAGIDTPELPAKSYAITGKLGRAKCVQEAELALKAKERLVELLSSHKKMKIINFKWGRNGGRIVADVFIDGKNIGNILMNEGFAVEYKGYGPKHNWCNLTN